MLTKALGQSHAKAILMGEHSVVYGEPAIAIPLLNINMIVTIILRHDHQQLIKSRYYNGSLSDLAGAYEGVRQLIVFLLGKFNTPDLGFELTLNSQIPQERGMGSSAATSIAVIRAFYELFEEPLDRKTLLKMANIEESITHGSPSGIDTATSSSEDPIFFIKNQEVTPFKIDVPGYLVISDTGIMGQTGLAVSAVRHLFDEEPSKTRRLISDLGEAAAAAKTALQTGDLVGLGQLMTKAHAHLRTLGVSHPHLETLVKTAIEKNALGAKLTGSGIGGSIIALAKNLTDAQHIAEALSEVGAQEYWISPLASQTNMEHLINE